MITIKEAEELCVELFSKIEDSKQRSFFILHSKLVGDTACILGKKDLSLDFESMKIAGFLHDIGRIINSDNHAKLSIEILKNKGILINSIIEDCIINHGRDMCPKTKEGLLIQVSDKVSVFDKETLNLIFEDFSSNDINYLKSMANRGILLLERLI